MPATIYGELSTDASDIILVAAGPDEQIAFASKQIALLTPLISKTDPRGGLQMATTWAGVIQLAETFGRMWSPGPRLRAWIAEQLELRFAPTRPLTATPPAGLIPRGYQAEGANLIAETGRALIFDEPRTGKTITAILGLVEREAAGHPVTPIVVVCPASVVDPWVEHFQAWAPQWAAVTWRGGPAKRRELAGTAQVYVTSFDTARRDAKGTVLRDNPLMAVKPMSVVVDECHRTKNQGTAQSQAVRQLASKADNFLALSGTAITHHPANLWPTLHSLSPGAWPSRERWVARYCLAVPGDYGEDILGLHQGTEPEFRTALAGQYRRVARADVLDEMPKVYSVRTVELPAEYRKAYDAMEEQMLAEMPDGGEMSVMDVLSKLGVLQLMACAATAMTITYETVVVDGLEVSKPHRHTTLKAPSWKVDALLEVLEERPGDNVLAFAPSKQLMVLAGEAAAKRGLQVGYVIGGQKAADRTATVKAFQAGELDLLCATTGAGGTGLTLSAAGTLVFLQRPYSLVDSLQSEDRAEGDQTKTRGTEVIDIVASNTIDTRVRSILRQRAGQLADLVQDPRIVAELLGGASVTRLRKAS